MANDKKIDWAKVQAFMNDKVTGEVGVTSKDIFNAVHVDLGLEGTDDAYKNFQVQFSGAMKSGKLVGFAGKKGRSGGIFPLGKLPEAKVAAPTEKTPKVTLTVGAVSIRLKAKEVVVKSGSTTIHTNLKDGLAKAAELLVADHVKEATTLDELAELVKSSEDRILDALEAALLTKVAEPEVEAAPEAQVVEA